MTDEPEERCDQHDCELPCQECEERKRELEEQLKRIMNVPGR